MSSETDAAAVVLGLLTYAVRDKPKRYDVMERFVKPLQRTFDNFADDELPPGLPKKPLQFEASNVQQFLHEMIIEKHQKPNTEFHQKLFSEISADPTYKAAIDSVKHGTTAPAANNLYHTLLDCYVPIVKRGLDLYLDHHVNVTKGFVKRDFLEVPADSDIEPKLQRIAQQLSFHLLDLCTTHKVPDAGKLSRTLVRWVYGYDNSSSGWVTRGDSIQNPILSALLGYASDNPSLRQSGSINQGLIHWYFVEVLKRPISKNTGPIPYTVCKQDPDWTAEVVKVKRDGYVYICCNCKQEIDHINHRIILKRRNKFLPSSNTSTTIWHSWILRACPPKNRLPFLALNELKKKEWAESDEAYNTKIEPIIIALSQRRPKRDDPIIEQLRVKVDDKINKMTKVDRSQRRNVDENLEARDEIRMLLCADPFKTPDQQEIAFQVYKRYLESRSDLLLNKTHYYEGDVCPLASTADTFHNDKSQRQGWTFSVREMREEFLGTRRSSPKSRFRFIDAIVTETANTPIAETASYDEKTEYITEIIPAIIKQFRDYKSGSRVRVAFLALGLTENKIDDEATLSKVAEAVFTLRSCLTKLNVDLNVDINSFEVQPKVAEISRLAWASISSNPSPFRHPRELNISLVDIIKELEDIFENLNDGNENGR